MKPFKLGIVGGMGTEAGIDLQTKIVQAAKQLGYIRRDQDFPAWVYLNATDVPDRTEAILGGPSPLPALKAHLDVLAACGVSHAVIACNTAHYWYKELRDYVAGRFTLLSMVSTTHHHIVRNFADVACVGVLATTGTVRTGIYSGHSLPFQVVYPTAESQERLVMEAIYGTHGIKAGYVTEHNRQLLLTAYAELARQGVQLVLAACTEIPLVFEGQDLPVPVLDPTMILAQKLATIAAKSNIRA